MSRFLLTFYSLFLAAHAYAIWRLVTLPWVRQHGLGPWFAGAMILLAAAYPLSRQVGAGTVSTLLEYLGGNWMGVFFYLLLALLATEVLTLGGWLFPSKAASLRTAGVLLALAVSVAALIQGHRRPGVTEYTVELPHLPKAREGFRLAVVADLHLGSQLREPWLREVIAVVEAQRPDAVALVGDLIDRDARSVVPMVPALATLRAPHGVFSVTGNHEYFADDRLSEQVMRDAGFIVLRNRTQEVLPGLHLGGVDDLTIATRRGAEPIDLLTPTLAGERAGATVLLSHSPLGQTVAAAKGVDLMLSGHTHDGQIWPFRYFVQRRYPHVYGLATFGAMTAVVTRGAGGWGPRMRFPFRGEVVILTLKAPPGAH